MSASTCGVSLSGKEGIRTLEALLTLTRFPGGPLQPLEHLSVVRINHLNSCAKIQTFYKLRKNSFFHPNLITRKPLPLLLAECCKPRFYTARPAIPAKIPHLKCLCCRFLFVPLQSHRVIVFFCRKVCNFAFSIQINLDNL
mgnify:CR=1 FL=1